MGPVQAATVGALVPALAAFGGWLILGETPSQISLLGIVLTVDGVAIANSPALDS